MPCGGLADEDSTIIFDGLSPARFTIAPWPAKIPVVGNVTALVKPALRADSILGSFERSLSAARSQLVVRGRSSGPLAGAAAAVVDVVAVGTGAVGGGGSPMVLSPSIKPG